MANRLSLRALLRKTHGACLALALFLSAMATSPTLASDLFQEFQDPPREFSVMPFWFWNDDLNESGIVQQIANFEAHGVYGFVIHPRIGLPKDIGWLSPRMIELMRVAIEEARPGRGVETPPQQVGHDGAAGAGAQDDESFHQYAFRLNKNRTTDSQVQS